MTMNEIDSTPVSRRQVLKSAALLAAPWIIPATVLGREGTTPPSEQIQLGVIGLGSRGFNLLDQFLKLEQCRVRAVCDVDRQHNRDLPPGKGKLYGREPAREQVNKTYAKGKSGTVTSEVDVYSDFRDVCGRSDLDGVVIATPDHWHAVITLAALRSKKDVYCEKPVTHLFHEGQLVYREVAKQNAIFQTGSQQRSDWEFRRAVELVRNGHLGQVTRFEVGLPPGYDSPQGDANVTTPPESMDYDFWCGPAPVLPYMRARHHRWWRGNRAYGGGVLMDWIGHHNDIAHWALDFDNSGPTKVEAVGWTYPETKIYDTPHQYEIRSVYPGGVTGIVSSKNPQGLKLIGDAGWVFVTRGKLEASDQRWVARDFDPGRVKVYESPGHAENFLDGIRSRKPCISPAETTHRSITPGHLGYVSQTLGRAITWDAAKEVAVGDDEANRLLQQVDYRMPWSIG